MKGSYRLLFKCHVLFLHPNFALEIVVEFTCILLHWQASISLVACTSLWSSHNSSSVWYHQWDHLTKVIIVPEKGGWMTNVKRRCTRLALELSITHWFDRRAAGSNWPENKCDLQSYQPSVSGPILSPSLNSPAGNGRFFPSGSLAPSCVCA